jgi:cation:H+ antiporter
VTSSVFIARAFGVSELVIGISLVAIGTSLPELATSMVASYRNEAEICVGNIVGSNIFNMLFVLGMVSTIAPLEIETKVLTVHFPIMLIFSCALFPLMKTGFTLSRREGGLLLGGFALFLIFLF